MTEREKIELQRKAFAAGLLFPQSMCPEGSACATCNISLYVARQRAIETYPIPQQPRVVKIGNGREYRVVDGLLQTRAQYSRAWEMSTWTVDEITALADLVANPLEDVK